jgi:hypothetical protein
MVYSLKLTFVANGNNPTDVGLAPGKKIYFESLEFIIDRFDRLILSPEGEDSDAVFVGMVHNGWPSLYNTLKEFSDEGNTTSSEVESSGLPVTRGCNVVTPIIPITTILPPENTPALLTVPTVLMWTAAPQPGTGLLPEQ